MSKRGFRAFVMASAIAVNAAFVPMGVAKAAAPVAAAPATTQAEAKAPAPAQMPSGLSDTIKAQTMEKASAREQLSGLKTIGSARPGEPIDKNHDSVAGAASKLGDGAEAGFAYVKPYTEPNDFAHRNYCGPGSAVALLNHFGGDYGSTAEIDKLGEEMNMDPASGVWIKDIVEPVNDRLSEMAGKDVNYYQYGQAQTKDDLRWMLDVDIRQNGVPLITGMDTAGMPGWDGQDIGHIIAVHGYWKDASGKEWVSYIDTAPAASGYTGDNFVTVDLDTFWDAVEGNSAQVW